MTLPELIKALEAATGPSRELDADILEATGGCAHRETEYYCIEDGNDSDSGFTCKRCGIDLYGQRPPNFTASVDAAIALCERVLPGYGWDLASNTQHILNCLNPEYGKPIGKNPHWAAVANTSSEKFEDGATPALALCIAVLRARLSQDGGGDE